MDEPKNFAVLPSKESLNNLPVTRSKPHHKLPVRIPLPFVDLFFIEP